MARKRSVKQRPHSPAIRPKRPALVADASSAGGPKAGHARRAESSNLAVRRNLELDEINQRLRLEIEERKRILDALRQSERLYRAMGESIDYGVWVCAPDGRNTYTSDSFLRLVGITQEQCADFGWASVLHPDDAERTMAAWKECVRTGGAWDVEHRVRGADGQWHHVLARGVPVRDERGNITCWAGINLDIGKLKRAEEALQKTNEELERRVAQRTARLQAAIADFEAFSYSIVHDLRAPLRSMHGFASLLAEEYSGQLGTEAQEFIQRILRSSSRMDRLIEDVLAYGAFLGRELKLEAVDVRRLLRGIIESYPGFQPPRAQVLIEGELTWVLANEAGLTQCLSNLLDNAVKFVEPGTHPRVRIWQERAEGTVRLSIADNGIGIEPEHLDRIFGMFQRLHPDYEGTGIGLAIVHKACERMGARVAVRSEPGKGSIFQLEMKAAPESAALLVEI